MLLLLILLLHSVVRWSHRYRTRTAAADSPSAATGSVAAAGELATYNYDSRDFFQPLIPLLDWEFFRVRNKNRHPVQLDLSLPVLRVRILNLS